MPRVKEAEYINLAKRVMHCCPNVLFKSAINQMSDGHFVFASTETIPRVFEINPRV